MCVSFVILLLSSLFFLFFFFNDTATTEIYTLSLHDALPISNAFPSHSFSRRHRVDLMRFGALGRCAARNTGLGTRSEEHTSELQSHLNLVCRLLLEKKNDILH